MSTNKQYRLECVNRDGSAVAGLEDAVLTSARWDLNGPGSIKYTMPQHSRYNRFPIENKNEVQLWVGTDLLHWCFHHKTTESPQNIQFECPGLLQYFDFRFILNTSLEYDDTEQLTIAAAIVEAMQSLPGQDWNISIGSYDASGTIRSRRYNILDHQNALTMLGEFPDLTDAEGNPTGFDFDIDIQTIPGERQFAMYFPTKGVVHQKLKLEWGRNITDFTVKRDGSSMANNVYYTGGSNGEIKFENHFKDSDSIGDPLGGDYGEWQAVKAQTGENDVNVLLELAQSYVYKHNTPKITAQVTAIEVPDTLLNVVQTGDWLNVQINHGRTQVNESYRVQTIEWLPGPGNLKIGFAES